MASKMTASSTSPGAPFKFSCLIPLLSYLERISLDRSFPARTITYRTQKEIKNWYTCYDSDISNNAHTLLCIYSLLLPELRCDRIYSLKERGLAPYIAKIIRVAGTGRGKVFVDEAWKKDESLGRRMEGGFVDLAGVVERVMDAAPTSQGGKVTVQEVGRMLDELAGLSKFSSEELQARVAERKNRGEEVDIESVLKTVWLRLSGTEAKWLIRVILRSLNPVVLNETQTLAAFHFLLPKMLQVTSTLPAACERMCDPEMVEMEFPKVVRWKHREAYFKAAEGLIRPVVGVKVGRGEFLKASSVKQAVRMSAGRRMAVDRKFDGEYCQVHVDLGRPWEEWFKMFSKSGRDSTKDRKELQKVMRKAFALDNESKRMIKTTCILEGEILVYNDLGKKIMPFHKLRQHIPRSGCWIGTANDSAPDPHSHLMIVFFDCLLLNDKSLLNFPLYERRHYLESLFVKTSTGYCEYVPYFDIIDFGLSNSSNLLAKKFGEVCAKSWEGLVLKPLNAPYVDITEGDRADKNSRGFGFIGGPNAWIKLKKDYIIGLGDTADFTIIGASADNKRNWKLKRSADDKSKFYAAVLTNKEDVKVYGSRPHLQILFEVTWNINKSDLNYLQTIRTTDYQPGIELEKYTFSIHPHLRLLPPSQLFVTPLIFDILGDGFQLQTDCAFFTLRHPRVNKIHWDREFTDCVSFDELQAMAEEAAKPSAEEDISQEVRQWTGKLDRADKGKQPLEETPREEEETPPLVRIAKTVKWKKRSKLDPRMEKSFSESAEGEEARTDDMLDDTGPPSLKRRKTMLVEPLHKISSNSASSKSFSECSKMTGSSLLLRSSSPTIIDLTTPHFSSPPKSTPLPPPPPLLKPLNSPILSPSRKPPVTTPITVPPPFYHPLHNATLFLPPGLFKKAHLFSLLSDHNVGIIHRLSFDSIDTFHKSLYPVVEGIDGMEVEGGGNGGSWDEKKILLVDTARRGDFEMVIRWLKEVREMENVMRAGERRESGGWEVWDLDVVGKRAEEGRKRDWGLWRIEPQVGR